LKKKPLKMFLYFWLAINLCLFFLSLTLPSRASTLKEIPQTSYYSTSLEIQLKKESTQDLTTFQIGKKKDLKLVINEDLSVRRIYSGNKLILDNVKVFDDSRTENQTNTRELLRRIPKQVATDEAVTDIMLILSPGELQELIEPIVSELKSEEMKSQIKLAAKNTLHKPFYLHFPASSRRDNIDLIQNAKSQPISVNIIVQPTWKKFKL